MDHFKFHFAAANYELKNNHFAEGNLIIKRRSHSHCFAYIDSPFNDLELYQFLLSVKGCTRVDIVKVACLHSFEIIRGMQVLYRSTFTDNTIRETVGPLHLMNQGYYTYEHAQYKTSVFELEAGEFLVDLWTRQGEEVVHAVQLVTNRRRANFGGYGGKESPHWNDIECWSNLREWGLNAYVPNPDASHRIVALAGSFLSGALHRIGHYSVKATWEKLGPLVMVRNLLHTNRAEAITNGTASREQDVIRSLLKDSNDDIFRQVSSFIIP